MRTRTIRRMGAAAAVAAGLLGAPPAATADAIGLDVPRAVVPGKQHSVTVSGLPAGAGVTLATYHDGVPRGHTTREEIATGTADAQGRARIAVTWERTFRHCPQSDACERRRYLPGDRISVVACTVPSGYGDDDHGGSATTCAGGGTVIARRYVARPARFRNRWSNLRQHTPRWIRLERDGSQSIRALRWRGWGSGRARATGTLVSRDGSARVVRRATITLHTLRECGGRLLYTRLDLGSRTIALAPCEGERPPRGRA